MSWLYTHKKTSDYLRAEATSVSLYSWDVSDFSGYEHLYSFTGSDWYRTAAAEIGINEVSFGFNLFTSLVIP